MKKRLTLILMGLILSVFAIGCGSGNDNDTNNSASDRGTGETITVTHELGETEVPLNPEKVVVFDMGILDALDLLGVDVAAVPQNNIPDYLSKYEDENKYVNVGTLKEPDFEAIFGVEPDLIIISSRQAEAYEELSEIAPTVYMAIDTTNFVASFKENMELVGKIFDKEEEIKEEVTKIEDRIAELHEIATSENIEGLIVMASDGNLSAYGPGSRFGVIHNEFGITPVDENIEVSNHGQNISYEYISAQDPDYLFIIDRGAVVGGETSAQQMLDNDLIKGTSAYENDNIVYLDPYYWYISTGGITAVNGMIDDILNAIQ